MPKHPKIEHSANYTYYADLLWCCVPLIAMSCYFYGLRPALLALAAAVTAYLCDGILTPLHAKGYQPHEPSSECFAVLLTMLLPASAPYSIVVTGSIVAVFVKEAFGGEGHYPFHPSAAALAVVGIAWPDKVFFYPAPGTPLPLWDASDVALSAGMNATLSSGGLPTATTLNLVIGNVSGPIGASCILVVAACGLLLLCRGHLKLSAFLPYLIACVLIPWLLPNLNELPGFSFPWEFIRQRIYLEKYIVLSGTMLFGGIFLASEPVTQPNRHSSRIIYGLALGAFATAMRYFADYETGFCFALLLVNAIPEWLDRLARRTERMRFMRREEKRLAQHRPE